MAVTDVVVVLVMLGALEHPRHMTKERNENALIYKPVFDGPASPLDKLNTSSLLEFHEHTL